jgi:hypothetical protein
MKRLNANACLLCNRTYAKFEFHLSNLTDMRIPGEIRLLWAQSHSMHAAPTP